jgi:hypothetical protein
MKRVILLIILGNIAISVYTQSVKTVESEDFNEVNDLVVLKTLEHGVSEVLVVLDIDNTLLTNYANLGGDVWYQWQTDKLCIKPTKSQKIEEKELFGSAIGMLYELGTTELTEDTIPELIKEWQRSGVTLFGLTSRSPSYRPATERELCKYDIDFSKTALKPPGEGVPLYSYKLGREMSYMGGIMMTKGMNKGEMLSHILGRTGKKFKAIIFVDDSEKNVNNIKAEYINTKIDFTIVHYIKIEKYLKKENNGFVLTKKQAKKLAKQWKDLNKVINEIFPDRIKKDICKDN